MGTNFEAPHCATFFHSHFTSSLLRPNILLSTLFETPPVCAVPLMYEIKSRTHIEQLAELWFSIF
jgi:hypothetical protein